MQTNNNSFKKQNVEEKYYGICSKEEIINRNFFPFQGNNSVFILNIPPFQNINQEKFLDKSNLDLRLIDYNNFYTNNLQSIKKNKLNYSELFIQNYENNLFLTFLIKKKILLFNNKSEIEIKENSFVNFANFIEKTINKLDKEHINLNIDLISDESLKEDLYIIFTEIKNLKIEIYGPIFNLKNVVQIVLKKNQAKTADNQIKIENNLFDIKYIINLHILLRFLKFIKSIFSIYIILYDNKNLPYILKKQFAYYMFALFLRVTYLFDEEYKNNDNILKLYDINYMEIPEIKELLIEISCFDYNKLSFWFPQMKIWIEVTFNNILKKIFLFN